jgi:integrase
MSIYDGHPGIKEDQHGIRASVTVGSGPTKQQKVKRFPRGSAIKTITDWQDRTRVALRGSDGPIARGRLADAAAEYLAHQRVQLVPSSYASLVCELNAWIEPFGHLTRDAITRAMVLEQRRRWLTEPRGGPTARKGTRDAKPHAPKTCNHRVRALAGLYHFLDGSKAPTPCDDVPKLREPAPAPTAVSVDTVKAVFLRLTDAKTRARFMVLAATGQRPAQLMRATPADVDFVRRFWFVRPAKGGNPIPIQLTQDMVDAFTAFAAADAWGTYDTSTHAKHLYAAGWPSAIRPYNTKHTLAITFAESGADWNDMRDWFGHQDVKSTRIYTGHVLARSTQMAARLEGRIGWPSAPRSDDPAAAQPPVSPAPPTVLVAASPKTQPPGTGSLTGSRQRRSGSQLVKNGRVLSRAENDPATSVSGGKRGV